MKGPDSTQFPSAPLREGPELFIRGDPERQALASRGITGYPIQAAEIESLNLICYFHFCPPDPWSTAVERGHDWEKTTQTVGPERAQSGTFLPCEHEDLSPPVPM